MIQFFHRTLFNNQYYLSQGFRAIFLRIFCEIAVRFFKKRFYYRAIIAHQKSCEKLANRRAASDEKPTPDHKGASTKIENWLYIYYIIVVIIVCNVEPIAKYCLNGKHNESKLNALRYD